MNLSESYKKRLQELAGVIKENFYHGSPYLFDKFDISKIGTGDSNTKFGWGLYFTDSPNTAIKFAKDLTIGKLRESGFNVYEVKLIGLDYFVKWEEQISDELLNYVCNSLIKKGKENDAEQLRQEMDEYGLWSFESLYDWLQYAVDGKKGASEFLYNNCHVNGVIAQSAFFDGNVYVAFSDEIIKIINHQKANDVYEDDLEEGVIEEGYEDIQELKQLSDDILKKIAEKSIDYINNKANSEVQINFAPVSLSQIENNGKYKNLDNFLKEKKLSVYISPYQFAKRGQSADYKTHSFNKRIEYSPTFKEGFQIELYLDYKYLFYKIEDARKYRKILTVNDLYLILFFLVRSNLLHELQHAYDDYRSKNKTFQTKQNKEFLSVQDKIQDDLEVSKKYLNLPHEIWARFSEAIVDTKFFDVDFKNGGILFEIKPIDEVVKDFKMKFYSFDLLDDKMKKKLISKVVQFWHFEKDKTDEKNKKFKDVKEPIEEPVLAEVWIDSKKMKKLIRTNYALGDILDNTEASGSDWMVGGCWILADALVEYYDAKLYVIYNKNMNRVEHFMAKLNNNAYMDSSGVETEDKKLNNVKDEIFNYSTDGLVILPYTSDMNTDNIVRDLEASKKLVDLFHRAEKLKEVRNMIRETLLLQERKLKFKKLEDNKIPLTDEERTQVMKSKAIWHHGPNGKPSPAVWKSEDKKTGKITYVTNTHRAFNTAPTLKGAIGRYHNFIKGTA